MRFPRRVRRSRLVAVVALAVWLVAPARGAGGALLTLPMPPRPPEQPIYGPGGAQALFDAVSATRVGRPPTGYWLFEPASLRLDGEQPASARPLPVVVFVHGFTVLDPAAYRGWIDHIVRRGAIVVYPDYQTTNPFATDAQSFLPNVVAAVKDAQAKLKAEDRVRPDAAKVAVVGHSLGGVLAAGYAAIAEEEGLPPPSALMVVQPAGCRGCGRIFDESGVALPDLSRLSPATRALVVVGESDELAGERAARRIWADLTSIPLDRRDYVTLMSDHRGLPPLRASHRMPLTGGLGGRTDALDWYGTWKLFDLLAACSFDGSGCEAALGNTPQQRDMGVWSDGEPVTEARVTDDPDPPASTA